MKDMDLSNRLDLAVGIVEEVSTLLLAKRLEPKKGECNTENYKESISNIASEVDLAAERLYRKRLGETFPTHSLFGEECGGSFNGSDYCWVFDPLDGTSN